MDIKIFLKLLNDKHFSDLKKLKYKYPDLFDEFLSNLNEFIYNGLPLYDAEGEKLVFINNIPVNISGADKLLLSPQTKVYGIKSAEEEIISSNLIESIDFSRDSVRSILKGMAPKDETENRILGQKQGLEFIANPENKITEENLFKLYMLTVGDYLKDENKLKKGNFYRHDEVYVVSDRVEHSGVSYKKLPELMRALIEFINTNDQIHDLNKAAIIHFYLAYLHPYFDGNGRMARLLHLWFLLRKGYKSALFVPFSSEIAKSRKKYYDTFTLIENNALISDKLDVTPFISYFCNEVYSKMSSSSANQDLLEIYKAALSNGEITQKEAELWQFVMSYYGTDEFSTKKLEREFADAAYATIRSFVIKFERLGLLSKTSYGNRIKYRIS